MQQQHTSLQHRGQKIERASLHLKKIGPTGMNVDAIFTSSCNFHVINVFHCHLCVTIPISTTGLDEIQVLLTNRGMFGTYIRWGSQKQGLCNLIHTSPMTSESGRPIACRTVAIINKFLQPRQALLELILVLQQQEHHLQSHRMYLFPTHRKASDAAADLLHRQKPYTSSTNNAEIEAFATLSISSL